MHAFCLITVVDREELLDMLLLDMTKHGEVKTADHVADRSWVVIGLLDIYHVVRKSWPVDKQFIHTAVT